MFLIITLTLVATVKATVFVAAPCPVIKAVDNFNLTAYTSGTWFEIARYPNDWENKADCVTMVFKPETGNKFVVNNVYQSKAGSFQGSVEFAKGAGTTGLLDFISDSYVAPEGVPNVPVYTLGIDYNSYYIGYECRYDEAKKMRHDYAWVQSREKKLKPEAKAILDDILKSSTTIDASKLIWDHFNDEACSIKS